MKTLIKLPVKIVLLPVVLAISVISLLAKIATNLSAYVVSPVIFLCAIFSIYCAFEDGFLGFLIAISASVLGFLALLAAFITIEVVEGINASLIAILRS